MKTILPLVVFSLFPMSAFAQGDPQCVELGKLAQSVMSARIQGKPMEPILDYVSNDPQWNYPKVAREIVVIGYERPLGASFEASIQDFAGRVLMACVQDPAPYMME